MGQSVLDFHSTYSVCALEFNTEIKESRKLGYEWMSGQKITNYLLFFLSRDAGFWGTLGFFLKGGQGLGFFLNLF